MEDTLPLPPRELNGKRLFGYSMGDLGMPLVNIFTGIYLFQFYVYTINLDPLFVSVGIFAQLFLDALFAIIFGVIVDNKKPGKLGKRRPFLLIGLPIWFAATILIWLPPKAPQGNQLFLPTAIFFWVIIIIRSLSRSLLFNVYISMLPEQSQTLKNRQKIASVRTVFSILASIVALLMPQIVSSILPNAQDAKWWTDSGRIVTTLIPIIGTGFAIFGLIAVLSIFFSVDESFHNLAGDYHHEKVSIVDRFRQMAIPLKDVSFLYLLITGFFAGLAGRTLGILVFPFQNFVLEFSGITFYTYIFISIFGKFGWYFIWIKMRKRNDILKSYSTIMIFAIIGSFLGSFFLIPILPFGVELTIYIITWSTVLGSMYSAPLFSIPLTAALVHEAAENSEERDIDIAMSKISGSYYGLASFIRTLGAAIISLIIGFILSGENQSNPIIMVLLWVGMGFFYLMALVAIKKIKIKNIEFFNHKPVKEEFIEM
ncbi:MAG: MFS transporter [Candidatus Lokiarchaeota archaeon]|nr:MFS transporter [Candidatus Lokiarchaeota archaeon]